MASSWERLTSVTLDATNSEIETPTFTPKKHLRVVYNGVSQSADSDVWLQFGTGGTGSWDTDYGSGVGNNTHYSWRNGRNSNNDNADAGDSKIALMGANINTTNAHTYSDIYISNPVVTVSSNKFCTAETLTVIAGAGNAPDNCETVGRWVNSSGQINIMRVFLTQNSAVYSVGSTITVFGADDQSSTPFYPKFQNGSIFEEQDTGKIYIWKLSTNTWNEIT